MKRGKDVGPLTVSVSDLVVGNQATQTVSFNTTAPLYNGFLIIVNIPEECRAPMGSVFQCNVDSPISGSLCRINGQRVTIEIKIDTKYDAERIEIGEKLQFDFAPIRNPASTTPTQPYEIEIKTGYYQIVAQQRTQGARVIITDPALIKQQKFDALDKRQLAITTVTLTWISTQVYPKDLAVLIYYNQDQIGPELLDDAVESTFIPCVFSQTVIVQCEYNPATPGVIKVQDLLIAE